VDIAQLAVRRQNGDRAGVAGREDDTEDGGRGTVASIVDGWVSVGTERAAKLLNPRLAIRLSGRGPLRL
jgi:hypothetical protein